MINVNDYAEYLGKMIISSFNLIDVERKMKEEIVFVMRTKTQILNVCPQKSL